MIYRTLQFPYSLISVLASGLKMLVGCTDRRTYTQLQEQAVLTERVKKIKSLPTACSGPQCTKVPKTLVV